VPEPAVRSQLIGTLFLRPHLLPQSRPVLVAFTLEEATSKQLSDAPDKHAVTRWGFGEDASDHPERGGPGAGTGIDEQRVVDVHGAVDNLIALEFAIPVPFAIAERLPESSALTQVTDNDAIVSCGHERFRSHNGYGTVVRPHRPAVMAR